MYLRLQWIIVEKKNSSFLEFSEKYEIDTEFQKITVSYNFLN